MSASELDFFDPSDSYTVLERRLPHWSQTGVVTFITFRTDDSMPRDVVNRFHADRRHWLRGHKIDPNQTNWQVRLKQLSRLEQIDFHRRFSERWNQSLDQGAGNCHLRQPEFAEIVADTLLYFDEDRYELTDFVVMPNHVHVLAAFPDDQTMLDQCESWKRFTAWQINRKLGTRGRFWQQDGFDHLVRSLEQFEYFRRYIAANPLRAKCHLPAAAVYRKSL